VDALFRGLGFLQPLSDLLACGFRLLQRLDQLLVFQHLGSIRGGKHRQNRLLDTLHLQSVLVVIVHDADLLFLQLRFLFPHQNRCHLVP
jgi:hypothetical protein